MLMVGLGESTRIRRSGALNCRGRAAAGGRCSIHRPCAELEQWFKHGAEMRRMSRVDDHRENHVVTFTKVPTHGVIRGIKTAR